MFRKAFDELYVDIVWEFSQRFGKDACDVFYQADLDIEDSNNEEEIKQFLVELGHTASEDNIRFLRNYINACDKLEEACECFAGALGKTLWEYEHQDELAVEKWKAIQGQKPIGA